jgi:uncharacterized membrane protein
LEHSAGRKDVKFPNISIPKNYTFMLLGLLLFPLAIFAAYVAIQKRKTSSSWELSHCIFQIYTAVTCCILMASLIFAISLMVALAPGATPMQSTYKSMAITGTSNLAYLVYFWTLVRSIRGLYLAGAQTPILNPNTFWLWPRSQT